MPIDINKQLKLPFGKTDVRAVELVLEQIPKLEKDVKTCEVNSL
jgi:hypothetical protein